MKQSLTKIGYSVYSYNTNYAWRPDVGLKLLKAKLMEWDKQAHPRDSLI